MAGGEDLSGRRHPWKGRTGCQQPSFCLRGDFVEIQPQTSSTTFGGYGPSRPVDCRKHLSSRRKSHTGE